MKLLNRLLKNPYAQGGFFFTVSAFIVNVINYFFNSLAGRILGPAGYGDVTAFFSYISVLQVPLTVMSYVIIQRVSAKTEATLSYVSSLEVFLFQKAKKIIPFFIVTLILIPLSPRLTNLNPMMSYFIIPMLWLSAISTFYSASLQGLKFFLIISILNIVSGITKMVSIIPIYVGWGKGEWIVWILFISGFVMLPVTRAIVFRKFKENTSQEIKPIEKRLLSVLSHPQVIMTTFSIFALTFLSNADIIFVKKFFLPEEAGYYGVWSLFVKIVLYVLGPVFPVLFVYFSGNKNVSLKKYLLPLLTGWLICTGLICFIYVYFGKLGLHLLFGFRYDYILPYFGLAAVFGSLYSMIGFISNYFLAIKSNGAYLLSFLLPLYIGGLFVFGLTIQHVMMINIIFSSFSVLLFVLYIVLKKQTERQLK